MVSAIFFTLLHCVRWILTITRPYSDQILDFIYSLILGRTRKLPPIEQEILLLSATELANKIRKRQLTSEEVVRAYVSRCQQIHPLVNAVTDERYEDAILDSQKIDQMLASSGKSELDIARDTPLLGIPFSCKEALGVQGMLQTSGLTRARGRIAPEDSDAAALYKKAGAIPLTVTDVPELCMWWESSNHLYGLTRNPYNNNRTPGGSTGGEGALLASAGATIGIGTDIGGSIRIPSSFCGIYGHKPSRGVVSNWGTFPYSKPNHIVEERAFEFSSTGPMCRYVEDIPLLMRVLTDNDSKLQLDAKVNFEKVNVYYIEQLPGRLYKPTTDVRNALRKAVKHFEDSFGVTAIPLRIEELRYAFGIWQSRLLEYPCPPLRELLSGGQPVNVGFELFKSIFRCSNYTIPLLLSCLIEKREKDDSFNVFQEKFQLLKAKFEHIFEEDAIVLTPSHPEPAPHLYTTIPKVANISYTCIFNSLGYPVTNIPAGLSYGLPIGLQAVSGFFKDRLTIAAAIELNKVFGGWASPT